MIRTRSQFAVLQAIGTTTNSSETYAYTVIHGRSSQSAFYDANDGRAGTWPASATEDSGLLFLRFFGIDVFIGGFRGGGEPGGRWRSVAVATTSHCGGLDPRNGRRQARPLQSSVQSAPLAGACAEAALRVLRDYGAELGDFRAVGLAEAEAGRMDIA